MNNIDLKKIIEQHPDCVNNGSKLKGIILDLYPDTHKAVINTLVLMANSGMAKEIQNTISPTELDKSRWQKRLEDEGLSTKVIESCFNIFFSNIPLCVECTKIVPTPISEFKMENNKLLRYIGKSTNVVIPNVFTSIGWYAFENCSALTNIVIPNSITSIGISAFSGCISLQHINIPYGVTFINTDAFSGCSGLTSITIPDSVTYIGDGSFCDCTSLASIEISKSVTEIGDYAFSGCINLEKIKFNGTMAEWADVEIGSDYIEDSPVKYIICSDGTISV